MSSSSLGEKNDISSLPSSSSNSTPGIPASGPLGRLYDRFYRWRVSLGLPNPGTVENVQKEIKTTHLTNLAFDGIRADISKIVSVNPAFQSSHAFSFGSQTAMPQYNFGVLYATQNIFLNGTVDTDGNVNARFNQGWSANNLTKVLAQLSKRDGHNMIQLEHDYQGLDYSANLKFVNPDPADFTGAVCADYLQSLTNNIALGFSSVYHRQSPEMAEAHTSYILKYTGTKRNWIATTLLQPAGMLQATYWQKLSDKVEFAADLQVVAAPARRDAIATLGAKYDLRMATFRAQVDSSGKVAALLEQKFAQALTFTLSGEIDHFKNSAKVGVGVMVEMSSLTPEEMEAQAGSMPAPS